MPLLRLLWGLLSRLLPGLFTAVGSATAFVSASAAVKASVTAAAIAAFVLWLPMPVWVASIPSLVAAIPDPVVYVLGYARAAEGMSIVLGALVIRFVARLVLRALS